MSDDMVNVALVGGPEDGSGAPEGLPRVLYTAAPDGPPDVWHWRSWVP